MIDIRQARPVMANVIASFDQLGVSAPTALTAAHDRYLAATKRLEGLGAARTDALSGAVLAALEAGRDPATDPEVQRLVTLQSLAGNHGLATEIEHLLIAQVEEAATEHHDAIIDAWREPFDRAAAAIVEAHAELGVVTLEETDAVLRKGPTAATAWSEAIKARRTITTVNDAWRALHAFTRGSHPVKGHLLFTIAKPAPGQWDDDNLSELKPDPWDATVANVPLSLPTFDEFRARVDGIAQHRADMDVQAEREAKDRRIAALRVG